MKRDTLTNIALVILTIAVVGYKIYDTEPKEVKFSQKLYSYANRKILFKFPKLSNFVDSKLYSSPEENEFFSFTKENMTYTKEGKKVEFEMSIYTPKEVQEEGLGVMLYFHPGALRVGSSDAMGEFLSNVANEKKMIVVSADYRLSTDGMLQQEIFQDAFESFKWVVNKYGTERKYVIAGQEAGAKLSIVVSHILRDNEETIVPKENILVALINPWVCAPDCKFEMSDKVEKYFQKGIFSNRFIEGLQTRKISEEGPIFNAFENTKDLPSVSIFTSEYDYLKEQAELYYKKLKEEAPENYNNIYEFKNEVHGFANKGVGIDVENRKNLAKMLNKNFEEFKDYFTKSE